MQKPASLDTFKSQQIKREKVQLLKPKEFSFIYLNHPKDCGLRPAIRPITREGEGLALLNCFGFWRLLLQIRLESSINSSLNTNKQKLTLKLLRMD